MVQTIVNIVLFILIIWFITSRVLPPKGVRMINSTELKQQLRCALC
jgi:p-aminobenzoyl-glutamate transporter AbgT